MTKFLCLLIASLLLGAFAVEGAQAERGRQTYTVKGVVKEVNRSAGTMTVQHEEVTGYMPAMTMPFSVKTASDLDGLKAGDHVTFRFQVTETDSWAEEIKTSGATAPVEKTQTPPQPAEAKPVKPEHPLMQVQFTNQLGEVVRLRDFKGQALAITFFFTRCPVPNFCPRLSKNFQEASQKLLSMPSAPTNWHFLSITFDTEYDTPAVLNAYSKLYECNPAHWSFLTGPTASIRELASQSDVQFDKDGMFYNHNFRTLVIDAAGKLQMTFPIGGNLSDALVEQILKAAAAKPQETTAAK